VRYAWGDNPAGATLYNRAAFRPPLFEPTGGSRAGSLSPLEEAHAMTFRSHAVVSTALLVRGRDDARHAQGPGGTITGASINATSQTGVAGARVTVVGPPGATATATTARSRSTGVAPPARSACASR
jgi:hypothetical protein